MKGYLALLVCCSIVATACDRSEELHLICAGEESRDSNPPREWKKEFVVDLAASELIEYESEWRDARLDAETSVAVEVDASFIKIYDSLVGAEPNRFKMIVVSRITGEIVISELPENRISVAGMCSGAAGKDSVDS